jgi:hypothetical protein
MGQFGRLIHIPHMSDYPGGAGIVAVADLVDGIVLISATRKYCT